METKKCLYCGKEFEDNRSKNKLYCSRSCMTKAWYWKRHNKITLQKCIICWKEFMPSKNWVLYCSQKCRAKAHRINTNSEYDRKYDKHYSKTVEWRFNRIKWWAKHRHKDFDLTIEEYKEYFWEKPCYYCGEKTENGIDRIDNNIGYTLENCVPCCTWCNKAKNNQSVDLLYKKCQLIVNKHNQAR